MTLALIARLEEVFPPLEAPVEVVSGLARAIQQEPAEEIEAELRGRRWTEVRQDVLDVQGKNLICLTTEAFVHYLPAFLKAAVKDPDCDAATYAMYALVPLGQMEAYYDGTICLFTPSQAAVIADVLDFLQGEEGFQFFAEEFPAGIALWRRRAEED